VFDAYGNDVAPLLHHPSTQGGSGSTEGNALRFRWNGSYGYRTLPGTNVLHVGARHYSPQLRRWLQRDPSDLDGGHPNLYVYCAGNPICAVDMGGRFVFYVHGSFSTPQKWSQAFMSAAKRWCGEKTGHHNFEWSGVPQAAYLAAAGKALAMKIAEVWKKYGQTEPIYIFAHSHGGNIALIASQYLSQWGYKSGNIALIAFGTPWEPWGALTLPEARPSNLVERVYNVSSRYDWVQWVFGDRVPGFGKDSTDCAWTNVWYDRSERVEHPDLGSTHDVSKLPPFRWR
jgi:RHS repeat-associated protein